MDVGVCREEKNSRCVRIYYVLESVLGLPNPGPLVSKLRFRELCHLLSFIQLVNAGDLNPGVSPSSKLLPLRKEIREPWKQHGDSRKTGEAGGFHKLPGNARSSPGSHAGRITHRKRPSETGVCVEETVNSLQKALLSHTPESNCKNDILGPGFLPSSTSYLLRLQGKDDSSPCQGRAFPARDLKIMLCSFCLLTHPRP